MVASDDRLPHQIFTRGKMSNAIKTLSSRHLHLRIKRYLQKTSSSNCWNINIQQLSNRILEQLLKPDLPNTKDFYKWNRRQLQNLSPFCLNNRGASEKTWLHTTEDNHYSSCRILTNALKTAQFTWIRWHVSHAYNILWTLQSFLKVWPCWLRRHCERSQLFDLITEMISNQGFGVLWCGSKASV